MQFHSLVPFVGFEVANTFTADGASEPTWTWLRSGGARTAPESDSLLHQPSAAGRLRRVDVVRLLNDIHVRGGLER